MLSLFFSKLPEAYAFLNLIIDFMPVCAIFILSFCLDPHLQPTERFNLNFSLTLRFARL